MSSLISFVIPKQYSIKIKEFKQPVIVNASLSVLSKVKVHSLMLLQQKEKINNDLVV